MCSLAQWQILLKLLYCNTCVWFTTRDTIIDEIQLGYSHSTRVEAKVKYRLSSKYSKPLCSWSGEVCDNVCAGTGKSPVCLVSVTVQPHNPPYAYCCDFDLFHPTLVTTLTSSPSYCSIIQTQTTIILHICYKLIFKVLLLVE